MGLNVSSVVGWMSKVDSFSLLKSVSQYRLIFEDFLAGFFEIGA